MILLGVPIYSIIFIPVEEPPPEEPPVVVYFTVIVPEISCLFAGSDISIPAATISSNVISCQVRSRSTSGLCTRVSFTSVVLPATTLTFVSAGRYFVVSDNAPMLCAPTDITSSATP